MKTGSELFVRMIRHHVFDQINFNTLAILFCLMAVVEGFRSLGYVDRLAVWFVKLSGKMKIMEMVMVFSCMIVAMLLTNDVALIILVPFTIQILTDLHRQDRIITTIVLETIAANLGGMATPIGNPQNLYLYQHYGMTLPEFFGILVPYVMTAVILLTVIIAVKKSSDPGQEQAGRKIEIRAGQDNGLTSTRRVVNTVVYLLLFVLSILTVLGFVKCAVTFLTVVCLVGLIDRKSLGKVNYGLLIKFIILFLVIGNIAGLPAISGRLKNMVEGNELWIGILLSQVISNVPAAIMLSGFTSNGGELLLAVDLGGLGTLIASMASMISLDYYSKMEGADRKKYLLVFTGYNLFFLAAMLLMHQFCFH